MNIYVYIPKDDLIILNGILATPEHDHAVQVEYFEQHTPGTVMCSIDIDTFVYLEDRGSLFQSQLIQN